MPNPKSSFSRQSTSWGLASVRSAHARAGNTYTRRSSFVVEAGRCWRPGCHAPEDLQPDTGRALERNAEAVADVGMFAEERGRRAA